MAVECVELYRHTRPTSGLLLTATTQAYETISDKKVRACIITWNDSNKVHVGKGTRLYCDKPVSLQQDT